MPSDLVIVRPLQDDIRGQLGTVVAGDHLRLTAIAEQPIEFAGLP
jgi:hypothetical protein